MSVTSPATPVIDLASFYNMMYGPRGFALAPHHYPIIAGLEDKRIENLLFLGPPGAGKSALLCNAYPMWEIGQDPSLTILAVSAGEKLPQGFMASVMQTIQHDEKWKKLFPEVRPDMSQGWSLQRGLFVTGHFQSDPDASYIAVGLQSKALTGLHARLHIYDDIHDRENANSAESRAAVKQTYYDTLMGRADPRGARRVAAGRWWAEDDLYQEWIANGDWTVLQLPASRANTKRLYYDVFVPHGLECVYTETLGRDSIQDESSSYVRYRAYYSAIDTSGKGFYWPTMPSKRKEYETVSRRQPRIAAVNYDGDMRAGAESVFLDSDFRAFVSPVDLELGIQSPYVADWIHGMKGEVEQAWDTALGQVQSESLTVALTGLLVPCHDWHCGEELTTDEKCDFHFDVYLLSALVQHIDFRELSMALRSEYRRWSPRMVTVEEKQSGISLLQTFRGSHIPLRGQKVHQGKMERAINPVTDEGKPIPGGAASVQGWGRMGRILYPEGADWILNGPSGTPEDGFLTKVLAFKGGVRASDEFDALVHLVTRAITRSRKHGRIANIAEMPDQEARLSDEDPRRAGMDMLAFAGNPIVAGAHNPWDLMCGSPCGNYGIRDNKEWCHFHRRSTTAIGGCNNWAPTARAS